jgi:hypothetical protein
MKLLLSILVFLLFTTVAFADEDPDYRPSAQYYAPQRTFQPVAMSYEERLRRDYKRWQREQARKYELAREYERERRADRRRAQRLRDEEAFTLREKRRRAARRADRLREERALAFENRQYEAQRRRYAQRGLSRADEAYNREYGATCRPTVTSFGERKRGRPRAEQAAKLSWAAEVRSTYNNSYATWGRAQDKRYICDGIEGTWPKIYECRAKARPCRAD